jgi:transcriptional regulator with XRE-family HTH domain
MRLKGLIKTPSRGELEDFHTLVGKNVRKFRKKQNMSQLELAILIGHRSPAFLANAENNARNQHFNLEQLFKIANALGVNINDFFDFPEEEDHACLEEMQDTKEVSLGH